MKSRRMLWGGVGAVGLFGAIGGAWLLSLPLASTNTDAPSIDKQEAEALLAALKPPKRQRHPTGVANRRIVVDRGVATTTGVTASMPVALTLIEAHRLPSIAGRKPADALNDALDQIASRYGSRTADFVAMQLEYPRRSRLRTR